MKSKEKLVAISVFAVVLLILIWRFHPIKQINPRTITPLLTPMSNLTTLEIPPIGDSTNLPRKSDEMDLNWTNQVPAEKRALMIDRAMKLTKLVELANQPIVFYGRFVDQFKEPVAGVKVVSHVNGWDLPSLIMQSAKTIHSNVVYSDSGGYFTVKEVNGESLDLDFEIAGYEFAPGSEKSFGYGPGLPVHHNPDPSNPVIYLMWKRTGAAELVGRNFEHRIRADGSPVSLDLVDEKYIGSQGWKTVNNAAVFPGPTVRVWRDPFHYDPWNSPVKSWRYELIIPGGKIQMTSDAFCYEAPSTAYKDELSEKFDVNTAGYVRKISRTFYFINQQKQYGHGSIEIAADYVEEEAYVNLSVLWNPDGSRNLEPKAP